MKMNNPRTNGLIALFLLAVAVLACKSGGAGKDTDKANKLVNEGNAAVQEAKKYLTDAEEKKTKMMTTPLSRLAEARVIAAGAIADYDRANEKAKQAAGKYDEASRLQINEKFRDYLVLKAKEYNKRADLVATAKDTPQALIESTNKSSFANRVTSNNAKVDALRKEADDLAAQADKLVKDNPNIFKD
jgi:tetraacyldisaccharide-1-P 4'-kinase